jgi:hypothetical protein
MRALRGLLALVAVASVAPCGCRYFKRSLPADFRRGGLELVYGMASPPAAAAAEQMAFVLTGRIETLELCHPDVKVAGRERGAHKNNRHLPLCRQGGQRPRAVSAGRPI